uniref:Phycoerythrin alpha-subunit 1 n=1 Tax=Rhodomonas sp. (strain CS 24) TaxID=79257 RepID=Q9AVR6_RHDS2|nr:phycoerythrin alpha-subunit 1 [Rhodomonas sp. CS24]
MLAKALASLAVIGSAAAYVPMMSMDMGRREVVQAGAAAAAVTPFLSGAPAGAAMDKSAKAPQITIFDHRGCSRAPKESTGAKAGGQDDEMMVKVASTKVTVSEADAAKKLQEFITFEKGIDGPFTSKN